MAWDISTSHWLSSIEFTSVKLTNVQISGNGNPHLPWNNFEL